MSELDETKFWVALTKLQTEHAEMQKRLGERLEQVAAIQLETSRNQLDTDRKLRELTVVVHDLATIVAAHERRLASLEE